MASGQRWQMARTELILTLTSGFHGHERDGWRHETKQKHRTSAKETDPTAMDSGEERSVTKLFAMVISTDSRTSDGTRSCVACAR